jgi:hypothetical protein
MAGCDIEWEISKESADLCSSEQAQGRRPESILAKKIKNGQFYYLVKWDSLEETTWVKDESLTCYDLIDRYHAERGVIDSKPRSVQFVDAVAQDGAVFYQIAAGKGTKTISAAEARVNWPVELAAFLEASVSQTLILTPTPPSATPTPPSTTPTPPTAAPTLPIPILTPPSGSPTPPATMSTPPDAIMATADPVLTPPLVIPLVQPDPTELILPYAPE